MVFTNAAGEALKSPDEGAGDKQEVAVSWQLKRLAQVRFFFLSPFLNQSDNKAALETVYFLLTLF